MKRKIGMYGAKTRKLQRNLTRESFGLAHKDACVYKYLGSAESDIPSIDDIQSKVFFEVPDRVYEDNPISIPIYFEPMPESQMDFSRFGMINPLGNEQTIRVHLDDMACLDRWLVVGDVLEVPFFSREGRKAFWEVTDVDDKASYEKFYVVVSVTPLGDKRESRSIPIDGSNFGISDQVMADQVAALEAEVPFEGLVMPDEPTPVPEEKEKISNRRKKQGSFLDDPSKTY